MSAKRIASKLEGLSTKLWQEAMRVERLSALTGDIAVESEDIPIKYDDDFARKSREKSSAEARLRDISFKLSGIDAELQELALSVEEAFDLIEGLVPVPAPKTYRPPDAWT